MIISDIKKKIVDFVRKVFNLPSDFDFEIEIPPEPKMGDLSISCFKIAKYLGRPSAGPGGVNKIAAQIKSYWSPELKQIAEKAENVGPYLNFFLNKQAWFKTVCREILKEKDKFGNVNFGKGRKVLIEYSAPNTNKPQHLGHLRNDFLGRALSNLFSAAGFKVTRINLINDRGIHICKSMLAYQKWGEEKTPETENTKGDHFVGKYYVLFEQKAKKNPGLLDKAQKLVEKWEEGDAQTIALWQKMNKWAIDGINQTYKKIGVDFDYTYYESDIYNSGKKIILKALKKGLCYKREDGAIEIDLAKDGLDKKVLLRANGTGVYITQDIGLAKLKHKQFKPNKSIYVVASEQDYYFRALFKILESFGFDWVRNCHHLSYGMVFLPEGKMKSREGKVIDADDIISEMEQLAKGEILKRTPNLSPIEISKRAEVIALAALKFFFLKFTPGQDVHFDPQASLSFEGDTGPYIQYTYARIQSIFKKSGLTGGLSDKVNYKVLGNEEEIKLLKLLFIYPDILRRSVNLEKNIYNPTYLCQYLLKIAQTFNEFYHRHPVLKAESDLKNARLVLISSVAEVIKKGLSLLGIDVLIEM